MKTTTLLLALALAATANAGLFTSKNVRSLNGKDFKRLVTGSDVRSALHDSTQLDLHSPRRGMTN